jgi:predicted amidohydrolase YtcJ
MREKGMADKVIFFNGNFYTFDRKTNGAQAIAVENGRIVDSGSNAKIRPLIKRGFKAIDLGKRAVVPGMFDSHLHMLSLGISFKRVNLDGIGTLDKVKAILRDAATRLASGQWLRGRGWNKNLWGEGFPDKGILDKITSNPVALGSKDGHLLWVNSAALKYAGIDSTTPNPPGGIIEKDANGEPTGILKENAADILFDIIPPLSYADKIDSVYRAQNHLLRLGIVGAGDCDEDRDLFSIYDELDGKNELKIRIFKMVPRGGLERAIDFKFHTGFGSQHFRVGCLKLFADGALGSQTALMFKPYERSKENFGVETLTPQEIDDLVARAVNAGISVAMHAIGDKANYQALRGMGKYFKIFKEKGLRPRIEHAQMLRKTDIPLFERYGIIASAQPIHATSDRDIADKYWGKRARYAYPFKTLLTSGARLAFGSDAPIETADPIAGIHAAVTRRRQEETRPSWHAEEKITARQAVEAFTKGAAYACCYDDIAGSITIGKRADFVVLSDNIFEVKPGDIKNVRVVMTVVDGGVAYSEK